jgi:hypothetical protein
MLSGFANNNRGFMNRTRAINQNFANAIGSTTTTTQKLSGCGAGGKCPTCYRCKGGTCYPANQVIIQGQSTPTLADFNNCMGLYGTSKFDGGFANAIGTPTKFNPVGYTPAKCVGGRCGSGLCCLKNGTNVATGVTADWCVPCSDFQKFDGGFDYVNGGFNYANGGCGDNGMLGL